MIQNLEISEQKNQLIEISAKAESAHQAKLSFSQISRMNFEPH